MARIGELRADPGAPVPSAPPDSTSCAAEARTDGDRLAAIGYCFGGTLSLELARGGADLKAVVGFHSGLAPARPEDARNIRGKVLTLIGADDPIVDNAQRRGLRGGDARRRGRLAAARLRRRRAFVHEPARVPVDLPGIDYHEPTDRRSWQAMLDLFDEVFG